MVDPLNTVNRQQQRPLREMLHVSKTGSLLNLEDKYKVIHLNPLH